MTREQARTLAPIIAAYGEGKEIELRLTNDSTWITVDWDGCAFGNAYTHWRIKNPEPVTPDYKALYERAVAFAEPHTSMSRYLHELLQEAKTKVVTSESVTPEPDLVLEAGKRYVRRNGEISGKIVPFYLLSPSFPFQDEDSWYTYTENGRLSIIEENDLDLIKEYKP